MAGPLTLEQATALRDKGDLSPATYGRMFPQETAPSTVSDAPATPPPQEVSQPVEAPSIDPDEARKQRQRELFEQHKAGVRQMEHDSEGRLAAETELEAQEAQAEVIRKRELANKFGIDSKKADEELRPDMERAEALTKDAVMRRANFETGGMQTADMKPETAAPATLVSDRAPTDGKTVGSGVGDFIKSAMGDATRGYDMQAQGIRDAATAGRNKAAEESAFLERTQKEDQDRIETMKLGEMARQAKLDQSFKQMDQAANDLASQKIDPAKLWASRTTGEKVMAGIGLFLGAFGAANGGGNKAVGVIQDAIDRDIGAQKANIDAKKAVVDARRGIYTDMLARFKDKRAAEEATRAAYLDNAQIQVKAMAAKYAGTEVGARAQVLLGELEVKKQTARQEFAKAIMSAMPVGPDANAEAMKPEQRERYVPGWGLALTKEDASKMKSAVADAGIAKDSIGKLMAIADQSGKSVSPEMRAEASTLAATLRGSLRTFLVGPGAVTETEQKLLDDVIANPTVIFSLDTSTRKRLETLGDRVTTNLAHQAKSVGLSNPNDRIGFTVGAK